MQSDELKSNERPTEKVKKNEEKRRTNKKTTLSINASTHAKLLDLKGKVEAHREGHQIGYDSIISYLIERVKDRDIAKIFENSLSPEDKVQMEYEKYCNKNGKIEFWEWTAMKLKLH